MLIGPYEDGGELLPLLRRPRANPTPRPASAGTGDLDDEPPRGCGWFDSSHELTRVIDRRGEAFVRAMLAECETPLVVDADAVQAALEEISAEIMVDISLTPAEV